MNINKFFKRFDINTYYSNDDKINNIDEIFNEIDNKDSWNKYPTKQYLNKLYNFKRLAIKNNDDTHIKKINFYIDYLENIVNHLNSLQQNIFSMIGTIFIPLSFIVGFFGMNFKSMGAHTLKKGIYTIKHAQHKLGFVFLLIITLTILFYIKVLEIF
jgi:Mg2+ and Co2+ transporter CorA